MNEEELRESILRVLKEQGFKINPHIKPAENSKEAYRNLQARSRLEQIYKHKKFLQDSLYEVKNYSRDGRDIVPENISLGLTE